MAVIYSYNELYKDVCETASGDRNDITCEVRGGPNGLGAKQSLRCFGKPLSRNQGVDQRLCPSNAECFRPQAEMYRSMVSRIPSFDTIRCGESLRTSGSVV